MTDDQERTLPPTVLGLEQARQRGQVARSGELTFAAILLALWAMSTWLLPGLVDRLRAMVAQMLAASTLAVDAPAAGFWSAVAPVAMDLAMLLAGVAAAAILANLLQVGWLATAAPVAPDLARISPAAGLRRIVSLRSPQRLTVAVVKLAIVCGICYAAIRPRMGPIAEAARGPIPELMRCLGGLLSGAMLQCGLAMLGLAALDYLYQRWQHRQDLRISPRQMRQEMRQLEGDAAVKQTRRRQARRMLGQQVGVEAPRANVVIVDDRGLAVAVRLAPSQRAPQVSAKAVGTLGRRMIQLARAHGRCVVEDASLARTLYRLCPAHATVPRKCLDRVAEILAYANEVTVLGGRPVSDRQPPASRRLAGPEIA